MLLMLGDMQDAVHCCLQVEVRLQVLQAAKQMLGKCSAASTSKV